MPFIRLALAALVLLLPWSAASAQDACPADWPTKAVGIYQGHVGSLLNKDSNTTITTEFAVGKSGKLVGTYVQHEASGDAEGTLELMAMRSCRAQFRWTDKYGTGIAILDFVPGNGLFFGIWGAADDEMVDPEQIWDGRRR